MSNPDRATAQTIAVMCDQINTAARDGEVQRAAFNVCRRFRGGPLYKGLWRLDDPRVVAESCWWAAKLGLEFVNHDELIKRWLNEADQLQLLIDPRVIVRDPAARKGDCAVYTCLIASFLAARGVPYEIVTVACDPDQPGVYSHVYPRAVYPDGTREPLDASHGEYPGWRVPAEHTFRYQVWDEHARPVEDRGARFSGLHAYRTKRRRGLGAMQCNAYDDFGVCIGYYDDGTTSTPPTAAPPAPPSSWDSFIQQLALMGAKIGGQVAAPQTTIQRGPGGQLLITGPSSSVGSPQGAALLGGTAAGSSPWLLIGAGIIGLVVVGSLLKGGR